MSGIIGEDRAAPAPIRALEFWKEFEGAPGQDPREVHWVRWAKVGDFHYHQQVEKVSRLSKVVRRSNGIEEYDPIWLALKPAYDAWKLGQEAPVNGTSLDAWSALNKRQANALRDYGIRSVEELAAMTDGDLPRLRVPDARKLRNTARAYIEDKKGSAAIQGELAQRDEEIAQLRAMVAEMQAALQNVALQTTAKPEGGMI